MDAHGGTQFDAEFVKKDHAMVTFRKADGTEFTMNMAKLSKEDRNYVVQQPKDAPLPAEPPQVGPGPAGQRVPRNPANRQAGAPPWTANIRYNRNPFGSALAAHVEIDFPPAQHHYAFDLTRDVISLSIGKQFALLDKQFHFAEDEVLTVKRQLAAVKAQVFYKGQSVRIPLD